MEPVHFDPSLGDRYPRCRRNDVRNSCRHAGASPVRDVAGLNNWLATIRAALNNGLCAWVASATGQNPPPQAERIQYPICSTPKDYARQRKRLSGVLQDILDKVEAGQPYKGAYGPESTLVYWAHAVIGGGRMRPPPVVAIVVVWP